MWTASNWRDFEVIDTADGEKLERWGKAVLLRPDPQVIWPGDFSHPAWKQVQAHYHRSANGGGEWEYKARLPEQWNISYQDLTFKVRPTGFKHVGLFPEQAVNWDWMRERLSGGASLRVLNLFAYTGGATLACAKAGAEVFHVDAAKGMVQWAKENSALSGLSDAPIHYVVEDCFRFVEREARRGHTYHGILMDPPSYGRGPGGEVWKIEEALYPLVERCAHLLDSDARFFLINAYTTGLQPAVLKAVLSRALRGRGGEIVADEIGLPVSASGIVLPCGASGRWWK